MLKIKKTKRYEKDVKRIGKQRLPMDEMRKVVTILQHGRKLPMKYRDHKLENNGIFKDVRECHIRPDWVLVYSIYKEDLILLLLRTRSHSEVLE